MQHFIPEMGEWDAQLREEGMCEGLRRMLLRLLSRRFGKLPARVRKRVENAESAELERWGDRVLDAETLDAVFDA